MLAGINPDRSFHLELELKVPSKKDGDRVDSLFQPKPDQRLDVNARC
jgi:hypothetical protein